MKGWPKIKLSSWSRFEHFSESLIQPIGSYIWPLLALIHMKSWPKLLFAAIWFYLPLLGPKIPCLSIFSITFTTIWPNVALITIIWSYLQLFMEILHFKELGDTECCHECSLCVYLVIDNFIWCTFWCFTPVSNLKAIGQLVMEILHLKDLGNTASVITNAVDVVLGVSNFNTKVPLGGIYPPIKLYCNVLGIDNVILL